MGGPLGGSTVRRYIPPRAPPGAPTMNRFARSAWGVLAYDVAVAAWGAYVRATGSGAGCGRHWPLCNGEIIPRAPRVQTLVELSHRVTSGIALLLTAALFAWALRAYPRGHRVRRGATAALALMVAEALLGAMLVLFELVAHDASMKRALSVSLHLSNTFLLLASTALTAFWASGGAPVRVRGQGPMRWVVAVPLAATLLVGATGALTALGDTLFPAASLASGVAQDLLPGAHLFVRLRALHPVLAVLDATLLVVGASGMRAMRGGQPLRGLSLALSGLAVAQVGGGLLDVALLAPVWLQLVHLVLADSVWIALVLASAAALAADDARPFADGASGAEHVEERPGPEQRRPAVEQDRRAGHVRARG